LKPSGKIVKKIDNLKSKLGQLNENINSEAI